MLDAELTLIELRALAPSIGPELEPRIRRASIDAGYVAADLTTLPFVLRVSRQECDSMLARSLDIAISYWIGHAIRRARLGARDGLIEMARKFCGWAPECMGSAAG